jgi:hypothetical protein
MNIIILYSGFCQCWTCPQLALKIVNFDHDQTPSLQQHGAEPCVVAKFWHLFVFAYTVKLLYQTRLDQHFLSVMYESRYTRHV